MEYKRSAIDDIVKTIQSEFTSRYGDSKVRESVTSMQGYKSLPITTASQENEVGLVLQDVILVSKLKELPNGETIPVYELFGENGVKILETQDDGLMKFDREIFEDMIKDKIKAIQATGYDVAGIDLDGNLESFFELINGKVITINKEQKERLDRGSDKEALRDDIDGETANPEVETSEAIERENGQEMQDRAQREQQVIEKSKETLGFTIHQMEKVDDPVFRMNNPQTRGHELYIALTHDGQPRFITLDGGVPKEAEGFERSSNASGRTTRILNDSDSLEDNEINTYGEIYPSNRDNMRYTIERGPYGIKLVEQIRYDGSKMSETDKWISREVESSNTDYLDINREGAENSDNITARTFNQASQNTDANKYGHSNNRGGLSEVGQAMKEKKPTKTTMESMAADENNRYDEAKRMVVDVADKQGYSLDPDSDPDTSKLLDKRIKEVIDNMNGPFTEDTAQAVLMEIQMEQRAKDSQQQAQEQQERQESEQEEGRSRLEEEFQRKMDKR